MTLASPRAPRAHLLRLAQFTLAASMLALFAACGGGGGGDGGGSSGGGSTGGGSGGGTGGGGGSTGGTTPVITQQPFPQAVTAGHYTQFHVEATNASLYQWFRDGVAIPGATSRIYQIPVTAGADQGASYAVQLRSSSSGSPVMSQPAVLSVVSTVAHTHQMASELGATQRVELPSFDHYAAPFAFTGELTVIDPAALATPRTVERAGEWFPLPTLLQATVDTTAGTVRNLRERHRLYIRNGRLMRLDLAAAGVPTPARVSTLNLVDTCNDQAHYTHSGVFDDWTQPDNSIVVYRQSPDCANTVALQDRHHVAVRAGMGPNDAPIPLGAARPVAAVRTASGAITGYITYDGIELARVDAQFGNRSVVATNLMPPDDSIGVIGVMGSLAQPYLLYTYQPFQQAVQLRAHDLNTGLTTTLRSFASLESWAADAQALYLVVREIAGDPLRLMRIGHDQSFTPLAQLSQSATVLSLQLTPSRVIVHTQYLLHSVPRSGGSVETYNVASSFFDRVQVVGEDLYVQLHPLTSGTDLDAYAQVMSSDFTNRVEYPRTLLLGALVAESLPLTQRNHTHIETTQVVMLHSENPNDFLTPREAEVVRYGAGRSSTSLGRMPPYVVGPNTMGRQRPTAGLPGYLNYRYLTALQAGEPGLVSALPYDLYMVRPQAPSLVRMTSNSH